MANLRLKREMLMAVDNQIITNEPPCTKRTFQILQEQGYSQNEAKEMIAAVLVEEIYDMLTYKKEFDEKKYNKKLNELVNDNRIFDKVGKLLEPVVKKKEFIPMTHVVVK